MPQLKSGRHVGFSASPILDKINFGTDVETSALIMTYRLAISSPQQLIGFLSVAYFREGQGEPPNAPAYNSGFMIKDALDGKAGWSQEEVDEFDLWLKTDPKFQIWLAKEYDTVNKAIQKSLVWDTPLWTDDESKKPDQ
jgi:hypothetical protein